MSFSIEALANHCGELIDEENDDFFHSKASKSVKIKADDATMDVFDFDKLSVPIRIFIKRFKNSSKLDRIGAICEKESMCRMYLIFKKQKEKENRSEKTLKVVHRSVKKIQAPVIDGEVANRNSSPLS